MGLRPNLFAIPEGTGPAERLTLAALLTYADALGGQKPTAPEALWLSKTIDAFVTTPLYAYFVKHAASSPERYEAAVTLRRRDRDPATVLRKLAAVTAIVRYAIETRPAVRAAVNLHNAKLRAWMQTHRLYLSDPTSQSLARMVGTVIVLRAEATRAVASRLLPLLVARVQSQRQPDRPRPSSPASAGGPPPRPEPDEP